MDAVSQDLGQVCGAASSRGPSRHWFSQSVNSEIQAGTQSTGHVQTPGFKSGDLETRGTKANGEGGLGF